MSTDPTLPPDRPSPDAQPVQPVFAPVSPHATDSGLAPNVAAGLAVVLTLISGIIFLVIEKRNQFVRLWAMQATFFGATTLIFSIISSVISSVLGHMAWILAVLWGLFSLVVSLGFLAVWIIMLVKAFSGKEWEVPLLGKLAREQLNKPPVA